MKNIYKTLIVIFSIILIGSGCSDPMGNSSPTGNAPVRVQAPLAPPSIPLVPPASLQKIEVTWYQSTVEAMSRIAEGQVDVSILPVNSMAILYNKGADVQLAGVSTWGILYLASSDPQIRQWQDLKGSTVAVGAMGFSPDLVFKSLLAKQGLTAGDDVKIIYGASPEIAQMLIANKLSVAVLPEPLLTSVLAKNKEVRIIMDLEKEWQKAFPHSGGLPQAGLAVSKQFINKNPAGWQRFYNDYGTSLETYVNNPEVIGNQEEKLLNLPAPVIRDSLSRSRLQLISATEARDAVNSYLEQLYAVDPDAVGGKVPGKETDFYLQ